MLLQRDIYVVTKRYLCCYKGIFILLQRDIYVVTKGYLCCYEVIFMLLQRDIYVSVWNVFEHRCVLFFVLTGYTGFVRPVSKARLVTEVMYRYGENASVEAPESGVCCTLSFSRVGRANRSAVRSAHP
jgi:hypothetical protein